MRGAAKRRKRSSCQDACAGRRGRSRRLSRVATVEQVREQLSGRAAQRNNSRAGGCVEWHGQAAQHGFQSTAARPPALHVPSSSQCKRRPTSSKQNTAAPSPGLERRRQEAAIRREGDGAVAPPPAARQGGAQRKCRPAYGRAASAAQTTRAAAWTAPKRLVGGLALPPQLPLPSQPRTVLKQRRRGHRQIEVRQHAIQSGDEAAQAGDQLGCVGLRGGRRILGLAQGRRAQTCTACSERQPAGAGLLTPA
jgi:hypothetical protein